ncbi:IS1096 element passenger TnpR family protein [Streptomyces chiangmaiensis]|uniref:Plasmid pRiA4b Orf3-like domain-containing protein n=1 Tax=Streptomyces chiangmaiensis TaxID=766497 RepID=A0ABU7FNT8_9ACTN|nr:hypothetical protein [Streptomyces chiangmaiensis]MED7825782.1 hypothetical protein [Streptomyces chiangmaiensis]
MSTAELADVDQPPVRRRLLVPAGIRLDWLHGVLRATMGWQNYHMHEFVIAGTRYGTLAHPGAGPGADRVPEPSGVYLAAASDRTGYVESLAAL